MASGLAKSWQSLGSTILRDTLIANFSAGDLAAITENGIVKIFWEDVNEGFNQPFIVLQHITGGDLNSSGLPYAEMLWRVVVHTPSLATAGQIEEAIHNALARRSPVVNFDDIYSAGEVEEAIPVTDRYQVQNVPLIVSGGIYRLRISKG